MAKKGLDAYYQSVYESGFSGYSTYYALKEGKQPILTYCMKK